jgi:hypothetical protein
VKLLFVAIVATALLAGCSGDDEDSGSSAGDDSRPEDSLAQSLVLSIDDMPAGWAEDNEDDDDDPFEDCEDLDEAGLTGTSEDGAFEDEDGSTFFNGAAVFESGDVAKEALSYFKERFDCIVKAFNDGRADDDEVTFSDAKVGAMSFQKLGDGSVAYRIAANIKAKGQSGFGSEADFYYDLVVWHRGRLLAYVGGIDAFSPFPTEQLLEFAQKADAKLQTAAQ